MSSDDHSDTMGAVNHIVDKASDALGYITHALADKAPKAFELAVKGTYAKGMAQLIVGGLWAAVFMLCVVLSITFGVFAFKRFKTDDNDPFGIAYTCVTIACIGVSIIFLIGACSNILDSDAWARVIAPDGYLAQQLLNAAMGSKS